ncbi:MULTISPECIES: ThiF family adenylyltransferase [Bradyrhizobium]|uniref:ThiF family adenylyltransferase n=1 Tax=Bradyrhizobium TaxID=374 RepID=UPI00148EBF2D|nr:ThiF family adenylyltransferase [Bradyrhizobium diazoefficiens]AWO92683.2 thiamine biosynthesis protein ThiF [Bradyrhizobium diazoefficiens]
MTGLEQIADELHRTAKIALDTGEVVSIDDAMRIFAGYQAQFVLGPEVADSASLQAAILTAVNCATRTLLGGVTVIGVDTPLRVALPPFDSLMAALKAYGAKVAERPQIGVPTAAFGAPNIDDLDRLGIRVVLRGWSGGVVPAGQNVPVSAGAEVTPAGVLAGALAVSEIFQRLRGHRLACRRTIGLNLWRPEQDWLGGGDGPALARLPSSAWLVGLGNLGQAYLWTLGLLPYRSGALEVVLHDFDVIATSNVSTSLLTTPKLVGRYKSRAMADWAEERGFRTSIIERRFANDFRVSPREPVVALIGVDNALARQAIEDVGFERVIEAGLGKGPQDYLGIDMHTFPGARDARSTWQSTAADDATVSQPAYRCLLEKSGDQCGTVRLAGRSIGAPFVGAIAATLVIAEFMRLAMGAHRHELISCHLRDLGSRTILSGAAWLPCNPGTISIVGCEDRGYRQPCSR